MRCVYQIITLLLAACLIASSAESANQVLFCENQGQWDERVLYRAELNGATAWFTRDGVYYQLTKVHYNDNPYGLPDSIASVYADHNMPGPLGRTVDSCEVLMVKADFVRLSPQVEVSANRKVDYYCNFFVGDSSRWRPRVANYEEIVYTDIYPGIDIKYYGNGYDLEYDIVVHEGADLSQVEIAYEGIESLSIDPSTRVTVTTEWGEFSQHLPHSYERLSGQRMQVSVGIEQTSDYSYRFVGAPEHNSDALIIDPVLEFSTVIGEDWITWAETIYVNDCGELYTGGWTQTAPVSLPRVGVQTLAVVNPILVKFDSVGGEPQYSTVFGNNGGYIYDMDGIGCNQIVAVGSTVGWNVHDCIVASLATTGDSLIYYKEIGGERGDLASAVYANGLDQVYIGGRTLSSDFPIVNASQPQLGDNSVGDAFVLSLDMSRDLINFSTYLGGGFEEFVFGIAMDARSKTIRVVGHTSSNDFPITDPIVVKGMESYAMCQFYLDDAYVASYTLDGEFVKASCLGARSGTDWAFGMAQDAEGRLAIAGVTFGPSFPATKDYFPEDSLGGAFVVCLNATLDTVIYSSIVAESFKESTGNTQLGYAYGVDFTHSGQIAVTGRTRALFVEEQSLMPYAGSEDAYVAVIEPKTGEVQFGSFLGGAGYDVGRDVVVDKSGRLLVTGTTSSADFPVTNTVGVSLGIQNIFMTAISTCCTMTADFNADGQLSILDLMEMVELFYNKNNPLECYERGDLDGDGEVNLGDFLYLVDFMFRSGPQPASCLW